MYMYDQFIKPIENLAATALDTIADLMSPSKALASVDDDSELRLPEAFFARDDAQTEWWYYTGHCKTSSGDQFGFELVFFKRRTDLDRVGIVPMSLIANPMYAAHFAVTDVAKGTYGYSHRRSFGGALDTPVAMSETSYDVRLGDWSVKDVGGKHILHATLENGLVFDAILDLGKPLVLNGDDGNGISRKMKGASRHFSFTRMEVLGSIERDGKREDITGSAWMDREYGAWEQTNWDWFSIQFDDRTELMIYQFRTEEGDANGDSTGTFVDAEGNCTYLQRSDFEIEATGEWTSERTAVTYPSGWIIRVPKLDIELRVEPYLQDQELDTRGTTMVIYWEGACSVSGRRGMAGVTGNAYVELVGYDMSHSQLDFATFLFKEPMRRIFGDASMI
jgi:predicted secreted hydrolase